MTTSSELTAGRSVVPPAEQQTSLAVEQLLNSANAGVIVHRVGQIKNGFRSEGRQFARELAEMKAGTAEDAIRDAKLRPLVPFFAGVTMKSAGLTVTFEGKAEPGALLPLLTEGAFPFHFFQ